MRDRARMSRVKVEMRGENGQALGVGGFNRDHAVAGEDSGAELDHLGEPLGRNMLDNLSAEDSIESAFGLAGEILEEVRDFGLEALVAAKRGGFFGKVDA